METKQVCQLLELPMLYESVRYLFDMSAHETIRKPSQQICGGNRDVLGEVIVRKQLPLPST